jgi:hypothetical protein
LPDHPIFALRSAQATCSDHLGAETALTLALAMIQNLATSCPDRVSRITAVKATLAVAVSNLLLQSIFHLGPIRPREHGAAQNPCLAERLPRTANLASPTLSVKQTDSQVVLINTA